MSSRKRRPRLTPVWLPFIRDRLAAWQSSKGMQATQHGPGTVIDSMLTGSWDAGDRLRSSPIWWVSRDMTTLAADTALAGDLPDVEPPSESGFIVFQDGLPFRLAGLPQGSCSVDAVHWVITRDPKLVGARPWMVSTEIFTREKTYIRACDPGLPLGYVPMPEDARLDFIADLLHAVWVLSAQPTIGETRKAQATPLDRVPADYARTQVPKVKMLILRETPHAHEAGTGREGSGRTYTHRWIVRGFWRDQPYGKGRSLRRRQWIPPFVKGPADKPLIRKETVRIWRR